LPHHADFKRGKQIELLAEAPKGYRAIRGHQRRLLTTACASQQWRINASVGMELAQPRGTV
jgi:hypothetical protein